MNNLTNVQLDNFLSDYEDSVKIEFLEVGKEKDELIESAKKRGILVENSRDLGVLKTIYAFTDKSNANGAILPSKEFRKVLPQIIGKPMNINHNRQLVVGFYVDYRYIMKENKAISYAVFFKSNFPELWDKARKLQKAKKLSSSFEIWSPKEKRIEKENGEYELHNMEIAGGALIFEENGTEPAFKDAKVLNMAREELKEMVDDRCLVYASKYKEDDLIYHAKIEKSSVLCECLKCGYKTEIDGHCNESKCPKCGGEMRRSDRPGMGNPINSKIKCSNCGEEFESGSIDKIKCPKCFAIVNREGQMVHPPQIIDFKMRCPSCNVGNWLILSSNEDKSNLKCMNCSKEYEVTFETKKNNEVVDKLSFVYSSIAHCYQCGNSIYLAGISGLQDRKIKCKKCGLEFPYSLSSDKSRKIININEIELKKSSEEEENKMDKKVDKASEKKTDEIKVEQKEEAKTEVVNAKEAETKEVEKKEEVVEDNVEKAQKVEDKKEEIVEENKEDEVKEEKAEEQPEAKAEETDKVEEVKQPEEKAQEAPKAEEKEDKVKEEAKEKYPKTKTIRKALKKYKDMKKKMAKASADKETILKEAARKLVKQIGELKNKVKLYEAKAKEIVTRKNILGVEFASKMSDEDILNDDKYARAIAEKENKELKAKLETGSEVVGDKIKEKDDKWYEKRRKKVDEIAFANENKEEKR